MRERLRVILGSRTWERAITTLILLNAVTLGLETSPTVMAAVGPLLLAIDRAVLAVFVVEIALRLYVHRLSFFRDPWSVFDFVVVGIALLPATGPFSVLRALRILRVLRLISVVPSLRRVVAGLVKAVPGMGSIILLLGIVFYVASVMATKLFGASFPDWFGTIGASAFTLFQVMTLEAWADGIARPIMEAYPFAWLFFVPFILATAFVVLNLFIGVVVSAMQEAVEEEEAAAREEVREEVRDEAAALAASIAELHAEMARLRRAIEARDGGTPALAPADAG